MLDASLRTFGQPLRFAVAGALTAATYLGLTLLLSGPMGVTLQIAVIFGYAISLCLHFTLQRYLVFRDHDRFALAMHEQAGRYLAVAGAQYLFTAAAIATVPNMLDVGPRIVYVCAALVAAVASFIVLRTKVFHGG